jgi:flavodoxin
MKVLITCYSRNGNNEKLANELQAKLGCDVEKIVDTVNRKGVWGFLKGGMQAYRKKMSRIEPIEKDPSSYDVVIIAYPLWSSLMPPPIRTYIFENKDKFNRVALMSVSGSGKGNNKTIPDFETAVGKKASASLMLKESELKRGGYEKKLQDFSESILKLTES